MERLKKDFGHGPTIQFQRDEEVGMQASLAAKVEKLEKEVARLDHELKSQGQLMREEIGTLTEIVSYLPEIMKNLRSRMPVASFGIGQQIIPQTLQPQSTTEPEHPIQMAEVQNSVVIHSLQSPDLVSIPSHVVNLHEIPEAQPSTSALPPSSDPGRLLEMKKAEMQTWSSEVRADVAEVIRGISTKIELSMFPIQEPLICIFFLFFLEISFFPSNKKLNFSFLDCKQQVYSRMEVLKEIAVANREEDHRVYAKAVDKLYNWITTENKKKKTQVNIQEASQSHVQVQEQEQPTTTKTKSKPWPSVIIEVDHTNSMDLNLADFVKIISANNPSPASLLKFLQGNPATPFPKEGISMKTAWLILCHYTE